MSIIWRDDDILFGNKDLDKLLAVDDLLQQYGRVHTIAIIAETLTPELGVIIRARGMSAQLHCWSHDPRQPRGAAALGRLRDAVAKIEDVVGTRPTILYPPWNETTLALEAAAAELGLTVSWQKISLEQYIRCDGDVAENTVNFHYWNAPETDLLDHALRIASGK